MAITENCFTHAAMTHLWHSDSIVKTPVNAHRDVSFMEGARDQEDHIVNHVAVSAVVHKGG